MKIVEFYRGERGNQLGVTLEDMMQFSYGEMEMDHDYVQWMFPSNEPSMMNGESPVLTTEESVIFQADPELQDKVKQSFIKFLGFLGFHLEVDEPNFVHIECNLEEGSRRPEWWIKSFNHNMLRVTRVLKCLKLTGLPQYAEAFFSVLSVWRDKFTDNTWRHWMQALCIVPPGGREDELLAE